MLDSITDFILNWFDISALIIAITGAYFYGPTKNSILIVANLYVFQNLNLIGLTHLNEYYYFIVCLFELLFIAVGLLMRVKTSILIIFLISFGYNVMSALDFNMNTTAIDALYVPVMMVLICYMIVIIFSDGRKNGRDNNHNISDTRNSGDNNSVYNWTVS